MTILFDKIEDIGGADEYSPLIFWAVSLRENAAGDGIVTTKQHFVHQSGGVFTTPELDPGPAIVQIGITQYDITIPDSGTPVRLWPLVDAGMPVPPPSNRYPFVRNGGGVVRTQAVYQDEYASMEKDPATLYLIIDSEVLE